MTFNFILDNVGFCMRIDADVANIVGLNHSADLCIS